MRGFCVGTWCLVFVRIATVVSLRGQGEGQLFCVVVAGDVIAPVYTSVLGERDRVAGGVHALQLADRDLSGLGAGGPLFR